MVGPRNRRVPPAPPRLSQGLCLERDGPAPCLHLPEGGGVELNATAVAVLALCDGRHSDTEVLEACRDILAADARLLQDCRDFLAAARHSGWLTD